MTVVEQAQPSLVATFRDAMSRLVCGLAGLTAQRDDGRPCGILVSSVCSYSVCPPSVLLAVDQRSRCYPTLVACSWFGLHLLGDDQDQLAAVLASRVEDKFRDLDWAWDGVIPRLSQVPVYLRCRVAAAFPHGDHAVLIGEVLDISARMGEPLVYYQRRYDWRLTRSEQDGQR